MFNQIIKDIKNNKYETTLEPLKYYSEYDYIDKSRSVYWNETAILEKNKEYANRQKEIREDKDLISSCFKRDVICRICEIIPTIPRNEGASIIDYVMKKEMGKNERKLLKQGNLLRLLDLLEPYIDFVKYIKGGSNA